MPPIFPDPVDSISILQEGLSQTPDTISEALPFSQEQLSLALTIVAGKEDHISFESYCEDVLASVKHGSIPPNQDRYFVDTFHFWKGQYSQLLLKYHELEQENAYLKIKNSVQKDATSRQYQANQNSTNDTGDVGDGQAKGCAGLCKICQSVDFQSSFTWRNAVVPQLSTDSHSGKLKTHIFALAMKRREIESLWRSATKVDEIDTLAQRTAQLLSSIQATVDYCYPAASNIEVCEQQRSIIEVLKHITDQVVVAFLSCFRALEVMCETIVGRNQKGSIIMQMSMFFRRSLQTLHAMSILQIKQESTNYEREGLSTHAQDKDIEYAASKYLTKALSTIIYNIDWQINVPLHSELLEAIEYEIIHRVSVLLSIVWFDEHVANSNHLGNTTKGSTEPSSAHENIVSKNELRYIIDILFNALGGAGKRDLFARVIMSGKSDTAGDLLKKAKRLLVNTLEKTGFGRDIGQTLLSPATSGDLPQPLVTTVTERYSSDWYVEKVWELIGWDVTTDDDDMARANSQTK